MRVLALASSVLACLMPSVALGLMFSAPLPELVGPIGFPTGSGQNVSFSFGQEFSDIENVWLEIEAELYAREYDVCGTLLEPEPCVGHYQLIGLFSRIDEEDRPFPGTILARGLSFTEDTTVPFASGLETAPYEFSPANTFGWEILMDGEGSLTLLWDTPFGFPFPAGTIIGNITEPSGEILSARLIIDAIAIPEPSTALFVAIGLALYRGVHGSDRARVRRGI